MIKPPTPRKSDSAWALVQCADVAEATWCVENLNGKIPESFAMASGRACQQSQVIEACTMHLSLQCVIAKQKI